MSVGRVNSDIPLLHLSRGTPLRRCPVLSASPKPAWNDAGVKRSNRREPKRNDPLSRASVKSPRHVVDLPPRSITRGTGADDQHGVVFKRRDGRQPNPSCRSRRMTRKCWPDQLAVPRGCEILRRSLQNRLSSTQAPLCPDPGRAGATVSSCPLQGTHCLARKAVGVEDRLGGTEMTVHAQSVS